MHILRDGEFKSDVDGVHGPSLPGASFVQPNTDLRDALTREGTKRISEITALGEHYTPAYQVLSERAFVNGIVGLMASGSTNWSCTYPPWRVRRASCLRLRILMKFHLSHR